MIDSYVAVNTNKGAFREHFAWAIVNDEAVPVCDASVSASGRVATPAVRRPPSGR